jgi:hypothetical protein
MPYRYHGRASVDPENPATWAVCDRCGMLYCLHDLTWQHDWRGNAMANLRLLVCSRCLDAPSPWYRSLVLPPDPSPIINVRSNLYAIDEVETSVIYLADGSIWVAGDLSTIIEENVMNELVLHDFSSVVTSDNSNVVTV